MNTPPPNLVRGRQRMNVNWVGAKDMDRVSEWVAEEDFLISADYTDYPDYGLRWM